jgi:hypothetical protein
MTDFLKADIFFFVSSISFVILAILAIVAIIYVIRILKNVDQISENAKNEAEKISADLDEARLELRSDARGAKKYFDFFKKLIGLRTERARRKKEKK